MLTSRKAAVVLADVALEDDNGGHQEDDDPGAGGQEAEQHREVRDVPATRQNEPHRLHRQRLRQEHGDPTHVFRHRLDRPEDPAEHDGWEEGAHAQHGC